MAKNQRSHRSSDPASSASSVSRCSCNNRSCEMLEITRLLCETTDNFLLLQASVQALQQYMLPLLEELRKGQLSCLERWGIELDIYQQQMRNSVRPTTSWQQTSREEETFLRKKQEVERWYHDEQERMLQRMQQLQETMQAHEDHLEECALRFVNQGVRAGCLKGMAAVVQEHLSKLQERRERLTHEHEARGSQLTELQDRYQDEMRQLQASRQGNEMQIALQQKGVTTGWVVQTLLGVGTPKSLSLTKRVMEQMEAANNFHWYVRCATHYFWYVSQVWRVRSELGNKIQVLSERWTHWNRLLGVLQEERNDPTVDSNVTTVIFSALSGH